MATKKTKTAKKAGAKKIGIDDLLVEVQARFNSIEGKLDKLISNSAVLSRMISTERDPSFKTHATVNKNFPIPQDKPRERKMHKAVCAQCKKECEVPFVPKPGRPVYCKECYSSRRNGGNAPRNIPNREEIVAEISKTLNIDITEPSKTKPAKAKKTKAKASKAKKPKAKRTKTKK